MKLLFLCKFTPTPPLPVKCSPMSHTHGCVSITPEKKVLPP